MKSGYPVDSDRDEFVMFCAYSKFTNTDSIIDFVETLPYLYHNECALLDEIEVMFDHSNYKNLHIVLYVFGRTIAEYVVSEKDGKLVVAINDKYSNERVDELYYEPIKRHAGLY
jgi:hypothetical protein